MLYRQRSSVVQQKRLVRSLDIAFGLLYAANFSIKLHCRIRNYKMSILLFDTAKDSNRTYILVIINEIMC